MTEKAASLAHGELDVLILQALVRKLIEKGVLSPDDVRALLFEAATRLDLVGSKLTPHGQLTQLFRRTWRLHSLAIDKRFRTNGSVAHLFSQPQS